jgi:two-component system sensor histidine kinase KdpD
VGTVACVPDEFVRAGHVVLLDMPAEALRRRISSGGLYSGDQVGGALGNYFRAANLIALSELAQAWMAGTVDTVASRILASRGVGELTTAPVVVAGDSGSPWGEQVIRRAAQLARDQDAELVVVHVEVADGLTHPTRNLQRHRQLTDHLGGTYLEVQGTEPAQSLAEVARAREATHVVVARDRSRPSQLAHGSMSTRLHRFLPSQHRGNTQVEGGNPMNLQPQTRDRGSSRGQLKRIQPRNRPAARRTPPISRCYNVGRLLFQAAVEAFEPDGTLVASGFDHAVIC